MLPKIINVAVPSPQHSPIFGQLPDEHMVFNLYLSTKPLISEYFLPVGNFTLIHSGFFLKSDLCFEMILLVFFKSIRFQLSSTLLSKIFVLNLPLFKSLQIYNYIIKIYTKVIYQIEKIVKKTIPENEYSFIDLESLYFSGINLLLTRE
jgi:hypothetical protein